jgi:hypothetical protein
LVFGGILVVVFHLPFAGHAQTLRDSAGGNPAPRRFRRLASDGLINFALEIAIWSNVRRSVLYRFAPTGLSSSAAVFAIGINGAPRNKKGL